jgi:hypothetical protein
VREDNDDMTIEKNFFVLVESFIIDERQRVSLINMYDIVWAEEFPYTHPLLKYIGNSGEQRYIVFDLVILGPNNKEHFKITANPAPISPNTKQQNVGVVFDVQMLALPREGSYRAQLQNKGKIIAEHTLEIRKPLPEEA